MRIARERYLDDSSRWYLTLELWSRTGEMHSAMDALSAEQRQAIGDVLSAAMEKAAHIIEPVAIEHGAKPVRTRITNRESSIANRES